MPDLDHRFDDITEHYSSRMLAEIRRFARDVELPARVMLEIGTNRGRFLLPLAKQFPDRVALGIEIRNKYARLARRDLVKAGVTNAHVLAADAALALPIVIDDGQLTDVFVLYPDPWWKKRHQKRRVIRPDLLDLLHAKMAEGANLWVRTDVGPLADDMRDTLTEHPGFEPLPPDEYPLEPFPRSTRERKWVADHNPVHLVYFRRCSSPRPSVTPRSAPPSTTAAAGIDPTLASADDTARRCRSGGTHASPAW